MFRQAEFVGPLDVAAQAWSDRVASADRAAAQIEPAELVVARRESSIAELQRAAALLLLTGEARTALVITFGAVAEARALAEFQISNPLICIDCFVYGDGCARHPGGRPGQDEPSWHRFGG